MVESRESKAHQLDREAKGPNDERSVGLRSLSRPSLLSNRKGLAGEAPCPVKQLIALLRGRVFTSRLGFLGVNVEATVNSSQVFQLGAGGGKFTP